MKGIDIVGKKWTEEEEQFIIDNYKNMNDEEIGKYLNRSKDSVSGKRKNLGIVKERLKITSDNDKKDIIQRYQNNEYLKTIAKDYNIDESTLIDYLRRWNIFIPRNNKWNNKEIKILKENYPIKSWDILLKLLPKHKKQDIKDKANSLKIKRQCHYWTRNDIDILKKEYNKNTSAKDIIAKLNYKFTESAICSKANKIGIKKVEKWSDEELEYLINNYEITPIDEIEKVLYKRERNNITDMACKLGLSYYLAWTKEEDEYIKLNYKNKSDYEIATKLNRTRRSVKWRRQKLGLESHFYNTFGNSYPAKDGIICASNGELYIHNYLLETELDINKEVYYKDILPLDKTERRFDWVIKDKYNNTWLVEYFGMYDLERKENNVRRQYKKKTRRKIKDLYKAGIIDKCIFIFPNDLKNKTLDEIFGEYINLKDNNKQKIS